MQFPVCKASPYGSFGPEPMNLWSHSIRVGHSPDFGSLLSRHCHDCSESDIGLCGPWYAVSGMWSPVCGLWSVVSCIQCLICGVWYFPVSGLQYALPGLCSLVCGLRYAVSGGLATRSLVCNIQCTRSTMRSLVRGLRNVVSGIQSPVGVLRSPVGLCGIQCAGKLYACFSMHL